NRSTLAGRRRTLPDSPPPSSREWLPTLDGPSAPDEIHRNNPGNPPRRSAPKSTTSPPAPRGLSPLGCPADATCRQPSECTPAAPELPRLHATTNPADSRPEPSETLCFPSRRCARKRTPSGLPGSWLFVRHAPPPITPESTPGALARCFPDVGRLRHSWQVGHS